MREWAEYRKGYLKALLDLKRFVEINDGLQTFKAFNRKNIMLLLDAMIEGREALIKYGDNANITVTFEGETKKIIRVKINDY